MLNLYARAAVYVAGARHRDRGATAVEYALIIAGVAAVLAVVVFALQDVLRDMFQETCTDIAAGTGAPVPPDCVAP
ncbi:MULTISPECIES: Flp family type IVb pilin [Catenuloplanes]|uniref:Pilus assembly protein Flp/PilA n=1 Tax=Catenuloplanes niger TaxID=587534 RepID=A0AAE4CTK3_9ACTN|nr:Flp family type IVb pilin [Catenuloplanes niger]MDR7323517.1 pilus assembly protein Flp/PilA [Catenuloplanes niger]